MSRRLAIEIGSSSSPSSSPSPSSSLSSADEDVMDILYSPENLPSNVVAMAGRGGDPVLETSEGQRRAKRLMAFYKLLPLEYSNKDGVFSDLLVALLCEDNHTKRASILCKAWSKLDTETPGAPFPWTRAEGMVFARFLDSLLQWKEDADIFDITSLATGSLVVHAADVARLLEHETWVNDDIVDAFGALLMGEYDNVFVMPSYVWKDTSPSRTMERYLSRPRLDQCQYMLAPIHNNSHWTFLLFTLATGECEFHNSFFGQWSGFASSLQKTHLHHMFELLSQRYERFATKRSNYEPPSVQFPRQMDSTSCALYVCYGMQCRASANFVTQFNMATWRDKVELLRLHVCMCLLQQRIRPLRSSSDAAPFDPPSADLLDEYVEEGTDI